MTDTTQEEAMQDTKVNRNRLRRAAHRQGLKLTKSARRDPRALDYGRYWLTDQDGATVLGGAHGATLDQAASFLGEDA
jgi:hypothetical protein